jgi:hypothetical protein
MPLPTGGGIAAASDQKEEQKYNAVPPIEGFDFKPWIDEMGLEALPF